MNLADAAYLLTEVGRFLFVKSVNSFGSFIKKLYLCSGITEGYFRFCGHRCGTQSYYIIRYEKL